MFPKPAFSRGLFRLGEGQSQHKANFRKKKFSHCFSCSLCSCPRLVPTTLFHPVPRGHHRAEKGEGSQSSQARGCSWAAQRMQHPNEERQHPRGHPAAPPRRPVPAPAPRQGQNPMEPPRRSKGSPAPGTSRTKLASSICTPPPRLPPGISVSHGLAPGATKAPESEADI